MTFSFHRGSLALDFAGTVGSRASEAPEERLPDADALRRWLAESGLAADARPDEADLTAARRLREAIFRVLSDSIDGGRVDAGSLAAVNHAAEGLKLGAPQLDARLQVRWVTDVPLAVALGRIAADAIELLAREPERLGRCAREDCGALILSRSRSERRRWCSMELCGNRAKVAAYRARSRTRRS
ncbi:MAG TPA: CGNR zinc finger domain-containing protein [Myxococcales bacterium]|nr:CGNR zinc finger domain-containing protein [Myxococcales bacterium]